MKISLSQLSQVLSQETLETVSVSSVSKGVSNWFWKSVPKQVSQHTPLRVVCVLRHDCLGYGDKKSELRHLLSQGKEMNAEQQFRQEVSDAINRALQDAEGIEA